MADDSKQVAMWLLDDNTNNLPYIVSNLQDKKKPAIHVW